MTASIKRRDFLKTALGGGLAAMAAAQFTSPAPAAEPSPPTGPRRISLTAGNDHADMVFRSLKPFEKEIAAAIGNRRVVIKPNNVAIEIPLCATHADCLEGILEFLKSIGKLDGAVIAESAANGPTLEGFANYGYPRVAGKYGVKLVDLDEDASETLRVINQTDFRPHPLRVSKLLLDPNNFIISAAKMKTHDLVVATLSLKNIVVGAPIKDAGFRFDQKKKAGTATDKPITHGGGIHGINFNLYTLSQRLHPHLAIIDGYEGMECRGPTRGTKVDHRVCVAGMDWLAADRVAVELMGIDFAKIGYLNYCAAAGMGEADLKKIEIVGASIDKHRKTYLLADNIEEQLAWMKPLPGAKQ